MSSSRRKFLTQATGAMLGSALGRGALAKTEETLSTEDGPWDRTVEMLVVGTGFAGLAASIEAWDLGCRSLLVIDKMSVAGGNSAINGGDLAAAGTDMQRSLGIRDSADLLYADMMKAGGYLNVPELARRVVDMSLENFNWCRDRVGIQFGRVNYHGGHSVKRAHQTTALSGAGYILPMLRVLEDLGVLPQLSTKLERFILDGNALVGVEVRENWRFGLPSSGDLKRYRILRGCIICSGGFSNGVRLRQIHDPRLDERFTSTNQPGATGDCTQAAQMAGAAATQMDWIQLGPWTSPDEPGFGFVPQFCERIIGYGLMVDPKTGQRFFKETGNRKERADAIMALGHPAVILADAKNTRNMVDPSQLAGAIRNGSVQVFGSLRDLARAYDMPEEALENQLRIWNHCVEGKKDPEYDCMIFEDALPNIMTPFYAARLWPRVHHTMGGLVINARSQVLNCLLEPIEGLYAAGEVTGGVHGMVRLGGVASADCFTFGRVAARSVMGIG